MDGRRPDFVSFSSIEEDAKRRDFTINGMFYEPIEEKIIDFVGGQKDLLKNKVIRFIGDAEQRISEDKLRILRAIRFAVRFGFEIESESYKAIKKHAHEITQISWERIADELTKILKLQQPKKTFELLFDSGLIDYIMPEFKKLQFCEQPKEFHPEIWALQHTINSMENLPENASAELLFGTMLHDIGKPETYTYTDRIRFNGHAEAGEKIAGEILKRMKFSNDFISHVCALVGNHMRFMNVKEMKISKLKKFMRLEKFHEHLALHYADCMGSDGDLENYYFIKEKMEEYGNLESIQNVIKPIKLINGDDLLSMGFIQGPVFRTILNDVEDQQLEGIITTKEEAIEFVTQKYRS